MKTHRRPTYLIGDRLDQSCLSPMGLRSDISVSDSNNIFVNSINRAFMISFQKSKIILFWKCCAETISYLEQERQAWVEAGGQICPCKPPCSNISFSLISTLIINGQANELVTLHNQIELQLRLWSCNFYSNFALKSDENCNSSRTLHLPSQKI